jgi:hypothetical protein
MEYESQINKQKKKYRGAMKKKYKRLNKLELDLFRENNKLTISIDCEVSCLTNSDILTTTFIKAGNEGIKHITSKIVYATNLFHRFKNQFKKANDGVWLEYPLIENNYINTYNIYQKNKLNYLLSLYQSIEVNSIVNKDVAEIRNLHNIFNSNLKHRLRGRKCIKSLDIKKIVDIAVIANGVVIEVVEIVITNKLKKNQREDMQFMSKQGGFHFVEHVVANTQKIEL